jgi:hypothetical protein
MPAVIAGGWFVGFEKRGVKGASKVFDQFGKGMESFIFGC